MMTLKNILVATDFSEASSAALTYGRELAGRFGATLHVLHVAENIYVTTFGAETYVAMAPSLQRELEDAARARLTLVLVAVVAVGRGLAEVQRYWVARVRPDAEPHLVVVKTASFPSGHAANSMIFCLALALALTAGTRWQRPAVAGAVLLSLLIGTSRVMLGVHWPSDVIGGWAFGMLWVLLTFRLAERLIAK